MVSAPTGAAPADAGGRLCFRRVGSKGQWYKVEVGKLGLYLANGVAGNVGKPGAPLFHFSLAVDEASGSVTGHGKITQAVAPPFGDISIAINHGRIFHTSVKPQKKIVTLTGNGLVSFPPPAIGSYLVPFDAVLIIDDTWHGVGGWIFGKDHINDVPVKPE